MGGAHSCVRARCVGLVTHAAAIHPPTHPPTHPPPHTQLAALLRLEPLCEQLLSTLIAAAGVAAPAPHSTPAEAKQVCPIACMRAPRVCLCV